MLHRHTLSAILLLLLLNSEYVRATHTPDLESEPEPKKRWLAIGIPSMPRPSGADYLTDVVLDLLEQLRSIDSMDPLFGNIIVVVANMRPNDGKPYEAYEALRETVSKDPAGRLYFTFRDVDSSKAYVDDKPNSRDKGTPDIPGYRVRRQTRDVAGLIEESRGLAHYFMFAEDDFMLCPNAFSVLHYLIGKASRLHRTWSGIRVSFGLAGWIMKDDDLPALIEFLIVHQWRRPPDHLVTEFAMGSHRDSRAYLSGNSNGIGNGNARSVGLARRHMAFRHNLLLHLGKESVLGHDSTSMALHYPLCYQDLRSPPLWPDEAFQFDVCWDDDLSPCHFRVLEWKNRQEHKYKYKNTIDLRNVVDGDDGGRVERMVDWAWMCPPTLYPHQHPPTSTALSMVFGSLPWFWMLWPIHFHVGSKPKDM